MGRKKRSNDAVAIAGASTSAFPPPPPPPPLPPPPGYPPMMAPPSILRNNNDGPPDLKRSRSSQQQQQESSSNTNNDDDGGILENGERQSYPVKKYRPDSYYRSIEAFARYTKSHRMLDATYVRWTTGGATLDRPIVFGIRIAGSMLSWGRGKTRDAAIDAAIRAAFALVAAHGYDDFTLTDDCFTEEPYNIVPVSIPPPPPPPPPPPGFGGMMMGGGLPPSLLPPPPPGMPPTFSGNGQVVPPHHFGMMMPPPSFNDEVLIPQPIAPSANLAVATTVASAVDINGGNNLVTSMKVGLSGTLSLTGAATTTATNNGLVFPGIAVDENGDEMSMEEIRMRLPRFQMR